MICSGDFSRMLVERLKSLLQFDSYLSTGCETGADVEAGALFACSS